MARKRRSSGFEAVADLVALLPWWIGVALAAVSYVVLHAMAVPVKVIPGQPINAANLMFGSLRGGLALIGQYIVPIICLAGAALSVFRRRHREQLVSNVSQSKSADALDDMSWREFELLVGEAFRLQGYRVSEQGGAGPDGGIDLILSKGSEKFLVQCKQWKAFKVSVTVVRELYGVMAAKGAAGGFVVTSGRFTDEATAFASGRNIKLIDGPLLHGLIRQAKNSRSAVPAASPRHFTAVPTSSSPRPVSSPGATQGSTPSCPSCGSAMAKRKAKRGANMGGEFWGCETYPVCKGTRSI
jgi:restriction system protein